MNWFFRKEWNVMARPLHRKCAPKSQRSGRQSTVGASRTQVSTGTKRTTPEVSKYVLRNPAESRSSFFPDMRDMAWPSTRVRKRPWRPCRIHRMSKAWSWDWNPLPRNSTSKKMLPKVNKTSPRPWLPLPPEQMFELMKQMKSCIQNNTQEARKYAQPKFAIGIRSSTSSSYHEDCDTESALALLNSTPTSLAIQQQQMSGFRTGNPFPNEYQQQQQHSRRDPRQTTRKQFPWSSKSWSESCCCCCCIKVQFTK